MSSQRRWSDLAIHAKTEAATEHERSYLVDDEYMLKLHRMGLSAMIADVFTRPAWHADANCLGKGTAEFFPEGPGSVAKAMAMCDDCPVRQPCLDAAMADPDLIAGVWGGTSHRARRRLHQAAEAS